MTPEERRRNIRTGIILAVIAIGLMAWTFIRAFVYGVGA
ncbi:MAG: cytochrome oxidase small assembly protein [Alcaligenaceae bacterium]|nr:cytochrome oxidase small assembly protein [Alcaligenaceae bacterium]